VAEVAGVLEEVYKARYGISLKGSISHIGRDTTPSAKNVAKVLESEQVRLSFLNLCYIRYYYFVLIILSRSLSKLNTG